MSGDDHVQQIQIYILPVDPRRLLEESPTVEKKLLLERENTWARFVAVYLRTVDN